LLVPGLYYDERVGKEVVTHSMIKTFRRCPRQALYKYQERLKPKVVAKPLKRGTWMHYLLEEHHAGRDWRKKHAELSNKYNELFDEEKDFYGDLPTECLALMESYIWHYKADPWNVLETEFTVEADFPDGTLYRGKVDALIENAFGLWIVDHKTHAVLPDQTFRLLDAQSALYIWAARKMGIEVQGFIWNYLKTKAPAEPRLLKDGSRLSLKLGDTDWVTYTKTLNRLKEERGYKITRANVEFANRLKGDRYVPGEPQVSPFFRRDILEKDEGMLKRVAAEAYHTARRMARYPFTQRDIVERVVDRGCTFTCSYRDLCTAELMGGNTTYILGKTMKVGDPQDYYEDRAGEQRGTPE
jgi:RecB family exonuclease